MRTEQRTIYTGRELKEASEEGFRSALEWWRRGVYSDPAWASEHRDSLDAVLAAIGKEPPRIDGPTRAHDVRRCMAYLENNVLAPLRAPWIGIGWKTPAAERRRKTSRYGAGYRPGAVRPCPFTGYCADEDLLDALKEAAWSGRSPHEWPRLVRDEAERLWEREIEWRCSEEYFLEACDANDYEFDVNGSIV